MELVNYGRESRELVGHRTAPTSLRNLQDRHTNYSAADWPCCIAAANAL
jgi:hypothetical protein